MTKTDYVDYYIEILQDMCILTKRATRKERVVRDILSACADEYEMSRKLHDLYVDNITLDGFMDKYGGALV